LQILERHFPLRAAARSLNPSLAVPSRAAAARAGVAVPPAAAAAQPKVSLAALGKRVLADQVVMAPFGLVLFIGSMGIMEGRTTQDLKEKYQDVRLFVQTSASHRQPVADALLPDRLHNPLLDVCPGHPRQLDRLAVHPARQLSLHAARLPRTLRLSS
jgi:hypothetical protein